MSNLLLMSEKERDRAQVLRQVDEGHLRQRQAAKQLGLSTRQVRRLLRAYRRLGDAALAASNNERQRDSLGT